jgi:hypothetical protein
MTFFKFLFPNFWDEMQFFVHNLQKRGVFRVGTESPTYDF